MQWWGSSSHCTLDPCPGHATIELAPELVEGVTVHVQAHHRIRHRVHPHQRGQQVLLRRAGACTRANARDFGLLLRSKGIMHGQNTDCGNMGEIVS